MAERVTPLEMTPDQFRRAGHEVVERIADLLATIRTRPITQGETPAEIRALLGRRPLPRSGADPARLLG